MAMPAKKRRRHEIPFGHKQALRIAIPRAVAAVTARLRFAVPVQRLWEQDRYAASG